MTTSFNSVTSKILGIKRAFDSKESDVSNSSAEEKPSFFQKKRHSNSSAFDARKLATSETESTDPETESTDPETESTDPESKPIESETNSEIEENPIKVSLKKDKSKKNKALRLLKKSGPLSIVSFIALLTGGLGWTFYFPTLPPRITGAENYNGEGLKAGYQDTPNNKAIDTEEEKQEEKKQEEKRLMENKNIDNENLLKKILLKQNNKKLVQGQAFDYPMDSNKIKTSSTNNDKRLNQVTPSA